jgi:putative transposase
MALLFLYVAGGTYLLVADETVLKKSGKHTFGIDRFYSSLAEKAIPAVAFFVFALVHVETREAYTLCAEQVIRTKEEKDQAKLRKLKKQSKGAKEDNKLGRPLGSKNKNKEEITLNPELLRILFWTQKVLAVISKNIPLIYFFSDGHFGNHPSYQMTRQLGLHLISKMRYNATLFLLPNEEQKQHSPRQKYGDKINYEALPLECRVSCKGTNLWLVSKKVDINRKSTKCTVVTKILLIFLTL